MLRADLRASENSGGISSCMAKRIMAAEQQASRLGASGSRGFARNKEKGDKGVGGLRMKLAQWDSLAAC
jgi:hypothetical protein